MSYLFHHFHTIKLERVVIFLCNYCSLQRLSTASDSLPCSATEFLVVT